MRLLSRNSAGQFELSYFFGDDVPPYGILSHLWTADEVTYDDVRNGTARQKSGYKKLRFCDNRAQIDGLKYFWIDACCLDKSSSAEITEAINSMFRWFQRASKCYVYLTDVTSVGPSGREASEPWELTFMSSKWFERSWTLQELIAPSKVEFFSAGGGRLGDKISLQKEIHEKTGIPVAALRGQPLTEFSVSERLSWGSRREATRPEDQVYSLLGLFGVAMPIIYGEGYQNAFRRLQGEISRLVSTSTSRAGMRLLVTDSHPLRLETVPVHDALEYAILSHTWGDDEVTFEDMRSATAESKKGYSKLSASCTLAAKHGFRYIWVDTCCIDKSSSSELQEAICSMYMWYKKASICYVYLDDCSRYNLGTFASCKWFTRGWTLQELIAPKLVEFYDQHWIEVGTKQSLCAQIADITSIDPLVLRGADPTQRTVAERMSWAASRKTTRIEDTAYSLMGLFNVFMPMLYGEGNRAFIRLQEEIVKQTEDYTMFSWIAKTPAPLWRGMFAHSPSEFAAADSSNIVPRFTHECNRLDGHLPPALSSRGLVLSLPLAPCAKLPGAYLGWIACRAPRPQDPVQEAKVLCVRLKKIQSAPRIFARVSADELESCDVANLEEFEQRDICVLPSNIDEDAAENSASDVEILVHFESDYMEYVAPEPVFKAPGIWWLQDKKSLLISDDRKNRHLATMLNEPHNEFFVSVGFQDDLPWCVVGILGDKRGTEPKAPSPPQDIWERVDEVLAQQTSTGYSDRVKQSFGKGKVVSAELRAIPSGQSSRLTFRLEVEVLLLAEVPIFATMKGNCLEDVLASG